MMLPLMLVAIGYTLPPSSHAESEIVIHAEPKSIYSFLNTPGNHPLWAPWVYNPQQPAELEISGSAEGKEAKLYWRNTDNGLLSDKITNGETTITSSIPYKFLTGDLVFNNVPTASYKFTIYNNKANTQARILFQYQSLEKGPMNRLSATMFGNDIKSELDMSLNRLKSIAETVSD